jgi:hypothetical protein
MNPFIELIRLQSSFFAVNFPVTINGPADFGVWALYIQSSSYNQRGCVDISTSSTSFKACPDPGLRRSVCDEQGQVQGWKTSSSEVQLGLLQVPPAEFVEARPTAMDSEMVKRKVCNWRLKSCKVASNDEYTNTDFMTAILGLKDGWQLLTILH